MILENYAEGTDLRSMTSILGFGSQYKAVEQSGNRVRFCSACEVKLLLHDAKESNEHSKQVEVDQGRFCQGKRPYAIVRPYCT